MEFIIIILTVILSYLLGSVSSAVIISKLISGKDIRDSGSGNAGATNMLRVHGKKAGVLTLVCDILKGVIAVLVASLLSGRLTVYSPLTLKCLAGLFVVIGHDFPVFFKFRGGKGVATSLGVVMMLDWRIGIIVLVSAIAVMAITKIVSIGSIIAAVLFPILVLVFMIISKSFNVVYFVCALLMASILIVKHRENIKRLLNGTENKLK